MTGKSMRGEKCVKRDYSGAMSEDGKWFRYSSLLSKGTLRVWR